LLREFGLQYGEEPEVVLDQDAVVPRHPTPHVHVACEAVRRLQDCVHEALHHGLHVLQIVDAHGAHAVQQLLDPLLKRCGQDAVVADPLVELPRVLCQGLARVRARA